MVPLARDSIGFSGIIFKRVSVAEVVFATVTSPASMELISSPIPGFINTATPMATVIARAVVVR